MSELQDIKKILENALTAKNLKQMESDRQEIIKLTGKDLIANLSAEDRKTFMTAIGKDMVVALTPVISQLAEQSKISKNEIIEGIKEAIEELRIEVPPADITIPDIIIPDIRVPEAKVTVNVPPFKIPPLEWPNGNMPIEGWVRLQGIDLSHPLPVQLRDKDGKPVNLFENLTTLVSQGGSGGKHDFFTIKGFNQSAYSEIMNAYGRLRVSMETGGAGLTDTELRASSVPVAQVSGAIWSTAVIDIFGSTAASNVFNADNRIKVSVETGGSGLTDAELRASAVPVAQASGANWSVYATGFGASVAATLLNGDGNSLDPRDRNWSITETVPISTAQSFEVKQVSGFNDSVYVTGFGASVGASLLNGEGNSLDPRDRNWTITEIVAVSGSLDTVKSIGIARQTNPTAVSDGDNQRFSTDDLGRQLVRPVQARDLISTAYATLTNGTETTLKAAVAGAYLDLIYVMGANNSDVAVTVDIRAVTGGNIIMTLQVPANGTAGVACPVPLPQDETGNNWTADMGDITGTSVYLSALFSKEI